MPIQSALPIAQLSPSDLIFISDTNELVTDSLTVSKHFNKQHKDVLKKIESLDCSDIFTSANFCAYVQKLNIGNSAVRDSKAYQMTKDGFMFLVMGFTGKRAAAVKEAYINAFNQIRKKDSHNLAYPDWVEATFHYKPQRMIIRMQFCTKNEQINANLIGAARVVPHQVGLIKLSKTQLKVLQSIMPGEKVTVEQIAERCELSSSWASTLLKTTWGRGYLVRGGYVRMKVITMLTLAVKHTIIGVITK